MSALQRSSRHLFARSRIGVSAPPAAAGVGQNRSYLHVPENIRHAPADGNIHVPIEPKLPTHAQVVIAGSGMIGNSVAFHLAQNGWKDVVVLDKGLTAGGQSKTGSGMLGLFRPSNERRIVEYCIELYRALQSKGYDIGLVECGSLNLAQTKDRLISLTRRASRYKPTGLECHILEREELNEFHPYLYTDDLQGAVWVPEDAVVHPKNLSEVFAYLAYKEGTKFVGNSPVKSVLTEFSNLLGPSSNINYRISGVETPHGVIECDFFVNCGGIWAREIGKQSDPPVKVPICPAEHFFLTFKDIPELEGKHLPNVRDYDNYTYLRSWNDSFLMGAFEPRARPWKVRESINRLTHAPGDEESVADLTEEHWIHMSPFIAAATNRMPILKQVPYDLLINTPDAFTPDGRWIIGEAPEIANYYVCAGMNGNSLQGAGGVGKAVADWMQSRMPTGNLMSFELARFTSLHNNPRFLKERTLEVVGRHYSIRYPFINEFEFGRNIRTSPIHRELEARGAVFGERMGWERPMYFDPYHSKDDPPAQAPKGTFGKPAYFDYIEEEYLACREGVGIIDMSSFAKFVIAGEKHGVLNYLQSLCSNDIDIPVGGIISTGMLNEYGGYENDCMLVRKTKNSYFMVSPTQQQTRTFEWMGNHLPSDNSVALRDVTSMFTVLTVAGPKAKDLMQQMTHSDMNMHPFTYKYVNMGYASGVMVFAVTQTGEPGYSLYVPTEYALHLYDKIMTAGQDYGIRNVGHLALRCLRIEKFIPFWGEELTGDTTPNEVNRGYKVKYDKQHFIGKSKLLEQRNKGVSKKLVQLHLEAFDSEVELWPGGGEVICRNGEYVGVVTNSAFGFTLRKMICLGFVQHPDTIKGTKRVVLDHRWLADRTALWTVNIAGRQVPANIFIHPPKIPIINQDMTKDAKPKVKPGHAPPVDLFKSSTASKTAA